MKALFPGSFDPPTFGHLDIIVRASKLVEQLTVAVVNNPKKKFNELFSVHERVELIGKMTCHLKNIEVIHFDGLLVDCVKKQKGDYIIRGLRAFSDLEYEFRMALTNRKIANIETVFLMADENLAHISSTLIREIGEYGRHLNEFLPSEIEKEVFIRMAKRNQIE